MNELTFDYDALPKKDIQFVKQTTREVNLLLERSTGDIIAIGQKLIEMKNRLGHGHWRAWLLTQWPLDISLANRWMNVARKCGQFPHLKSPARPSTCWRPIRPRTLSGMNSCAGSRPDNHP